MQNNAPIDKGRIAVVVEKYQTSQVDPQTGRPVMKNRYATVGRATLWPNKQGSNMPNIEIELDTIPIGKTGPLKIYTFWDSENNQHQNNSQAQPQYQNNNNGYANQRG